jgi:hypothetical protein
MNMQVLIVGCSLAFAAVAEDGLAQPTRQEELQQVFDDRATYAAGIVAHWEAAGRESGRWNDSTSSDLLRSLLQLSRESLLAAGEAQSYEAMLAAIAGGASSLGQNFRDLVYTPLTPCRIVDTRLAVAGAMTGGVTRTFDADGGDLTDQGGSPTGCGIPLAVAQAVEMTIVAVQPARDGFLNAWGLGARPTSSVVNYAADEIIADTAIVPIVPGGGDDFALFSLANTHVVVDVLGYFAAPTATLLDCVTVTADALVPVGAPTVITALCPTGRAVTGGGFDKAEGTASLVGVWVASAPIGNGWRTLVENQSNGDRRLRTFARCCRVPGR